MHIKNRILALFIIICMLQISHPRCCWAGELWHTHKQPCSQQCSPLPTCLVFTSHTHTTALLGDSARNELQRNTLSPIKERDLWP